MRQAKDMWDFPVMDGISFQEANRVHPLMQGRVEKLLHVLSGDANFRRVVLFGSSLEFWCSSSSDIDLYVEKYDSEKKLEYFPDLDCEVDIVTNLSSQNRLYQEIERTGLVLFER